MKRFPRCTIKNKTTLIHLVIPFMFFCIPLYGQTVSLSDAKQCALNFFTKQGQPKASITNAITYGDESTPDIYVFNMNGGGWTMVSGDYRATPILAVGFSGVFDTVDNYPEALQTIISEFIFQIDNVKGQSRNQYTNHPEWNILLSVREPMRDSYTPDINLLDNNAIRGKIRWQQGLINNNDSCLEISYNKFAPTWNPLMGLFHDCTCGLPLAGCGPVAMGQVMWYWQWPKKSPYPYREGYNWNLMPPIIERETPYSEADEIAYLLKDCGTASQAQYSCNGTFTPESYFTNGWHIFGYNQVTMATRSFWDYGYSWIELVRSEIDNARPVVICGYKVYPTEGHYFVVDGYLMDDINLFHLNLGWGDNWDDIYVHLYDIDFIGGPHNEEHEYNINRTAFVDISPTYSDTVINRAFYDNIRTTDYELSLKYMSLPANGDALVVNSGARLQLVAGKEVVLLPGFTALSGSEVSVKIDDDLVNKMPIIVTSWPTTIEEESDGLYVDVKNANSYELTVRDFDGNIKYQTAGLVRNNPARIWCRDYDYDPTMAYECTVRFKNNFGRALQYTFRINEEMADWGEPRHTSGREYLVGDSLRCYPNPASGMVTVCLGDKGKHEITLYNAKGQPCLQDENINNTEYYIDVSQFPSGVYYLIVRTGEKVRSTALLIK